MYYFRHELSRCGAESKPLIDIESGSKSYEVLSDRE